MRPTSLSGGRTRSDRATMRDVAALAGVSLKTVSRVVNDEPGVSSPVRDRVLEAAGKLEYRHNLAASNLRRSDARTGVVGALVQDIGNSFSATMLRSVEDVLRDRGVLLLSASLDEVGDREHEIVRNLIARRVDGLILMPASDRQDYLVPEVRAGLAVVLADRRPHGIDTDCVTVDNVLGGRMAVEHLLAQGHRRIGILTDLATIQTAADRLDGARQAYAVRGRTLDPTLVRGDLRTAEDAARAAGELLDGPDPPTALFAARNVVAEGLVRALIDRDLQHRVAHVGFDDFAMASLLTPALTVIRQDAVGLGRKVAELLLRRIDGSSAVPVHVVLKPTLVQRGSGEISPDPR